MKNVSDCRTHMPLNLLASDGRWNIGVVPADKSSFRAAGAASLRTPARLFARWPESWPERRALTQRPNMTEGNPRGTRLQSHRYPNDGSLGHLREESVHA